MIARWLTLWLTLSPTYRIRLFPFCLLLSCSSFLLLCSSQPSRPNTERRETRDERWDSRERRETERGNLRLRGNLRFRGRKRDETKRSGEKERSREAEIERDADDWGRSGDWDRFSCGSTPARSQPEETQRPKQPPNSGVKPVTRVCVTQLNS